MSVPPLRPRIAVVDHDEAFLGLLRTLLRSEGYAVVVPPAAADPYPALRDAGAEVILLDVPYGQEGRTLGTLDTLRLDPATAGVPVLVTTATPGAFPGLLGREAEGLSVLVKPFDLDQLLDALRRLRGGARRAGAGGPRAGGRPGTAQLRRLRPPESGSDEREWALRGP